MPLKSSLLFHHSSYSSSWCLFLVTLPAYLLPFHAVHANAKSAPELELPRSDHRSSASYYWSWCFFLLFLFLRSLQFMAKNFFFLISRCLKADRRLECINHGLNISRCALFAEGRVSELVSSSGMVLAPYPA